MRVAPGLVTFTDIRCEHSRQADGAARMTKPLDQSHTTIRQRMAEAADLVTVALDALLPRSDGPESRLVEAMRYAVLGPGRRVRPYFMLETARLFDVAE